MSPIKGLKKGLLPVRSRSKPWHNECTAVKTHDVAEGVIQWSRGHQDDQGSGRVPVMFSPQYLPATPTEKLQRRCVICSRNQRRCLCDGDKVTLGSRDLVVTHSSGAAGKTLHRDERSGGDDVREAEVSLPT